MMNKSNYEFSIDAEGRGFLDCPSFDVDFELPKDIRSRPDLACAYALDSAKRGNFDLLPILSDMYKKFGNPRIDSMILGTIAYAGPSTCFSGMVDAVKHNDDLRDILDFCGVMVVRGELSYVPIFLEKYLANLDDEDAEYLTDYIIRLIGDGLDTADPDDFKAEVLESCRKLIETLGSDKALVFRGELYGVRRLATYILEAVRQPFFLSSHRARFEAATGIDCSSWYKDRRLRPLAAAATIEEFLESPKAARYEDGVRYFFGHRIPELTQ